MEVWREVKDYPDYEVSDLGRVKSFKRGRELILKPYVAKNGYSIVTLQNGLQGIKKVHQLVAIAFLNHIPSGNKLVVNHINFNKSDNRLTNLEIVTNRVNSNHKHLKEGKSSKYTGVHWRPKLNKWHCQIHILGCKKYLGLFTSEYEAHLMYQRALNDLHM